MLLGGLLILSGLAVGLYDFANLNTDTHTHTPLLVGLLAGGAELFVVGCLYHIFGRRGQSAQRAARGPFSL